MQENWIGKSVGVQLRLPVRVSTAESGDAARVHHARRHDHGRELLCRRGRASARPAWARATPPSRNSSATCKRGGFTEAELATHGEEGRGHRLPSAPAHRRDRPVWVGNYVLMGYGEGAVMGVPGHDERDFAFRKEVRPADLQVGAHRRARRLDRRWQEWYADKERGALCQLRQVRRAGRYTAATVRCRCPSAEGRARPRRQAGAVAPARLGHLAPALLGHADSRSSTATRAARCRCPSRTCRSCCPST
jgi:leucyl-tRNA synthetase